MRKIYVMLLFLLLQTVAVVANDIFSSLIAPQTELVDEVNSIFFNDDNRRIIYKYLLYSNSSDFDRMLYEYSKGDVPIYYLTLYKSMFTVSNHEKLVILEELYRFNKRFLDIEEIELLYNNSIKTKNRNVLELVLSKSIFNERKSKISNHFRKRIYSDRKEVLSLVTSSKLKKSLGLFLYSKKEKTLGDSLIKQSTSTKSERIYYEGKYYSYISKQSKTAFYLKHIRELGEYKPRVYNELFRIYRGMKDKKNAQKWYDKLLNEYPMSSYSAKALWLVAWEYEKKEDYSNAIKLYDKLSKIKSNKLYEEGFFRKGLCEYKLQDYLVAVKSWEKINSNRFYFWRAKAYEQAGLPTRAKSLYEKSMSYGILNYYAIRSAQKLNENFIFQKNEEINYCDTRLVRDVKVLDKLGLNYFIRYYVKLLNRGEKLYLSHYLQENGNYEDAFRLVQDYNYTSLIKRKNPSINHLKLMYPDIFQDSTLKFKQKFVELSIMKQESNYIEKIISPAGAIGLMQIMPKTGKYIARQMNIPFSNDSLFNGAYNFNIGSKFIGDLIQGYNGNLLYSIAAYNAGGSRVNRWRKVLDKFDDDVRVESVEFEETRNYLRAVYRNYYIYSSLYNNGSKVDFDLGVQ